MPIARVKGAEDKREKIVGGKHCQKEKTGELSHHIKPSGQRYKRTQRAVLPVNAHGMHTVLTYIPASDRLFRLNLLAIGDADIMKNLIPVNRLRKRLISKVEITEIVYVSGSGRCPGRPTRNSVPPVYSRGSRSLSISGSSNTCRFSV